MKFERTVLAMPLTQIFSFAEFELKHSLSIILNVPCGINCSDRAFIDSKSIDKNDFVLPLLDDLPHIS